MARKRMISPSMWESLSFSELSDFSKLVFISLISHADDEGRGKAKAATVTNITFPNDENRRVADVKKALSEIALKMSVQFYSVDGNEYYVMTNWLDYQKIDKPTKSKLPPPPSVGEGGAIPSNSKIDDNSGSGRGGIGESSPPNIIEDNIIKNNTEVSKKVSNKKENLQSYDEILADMEVSDRLKSCIIDFIRHLKTSFQVLMINSRLENLIVKLDEKYGSDDVAKCREVRRAIVNGYKRLECENVEL